MPSFTNKDRRLVKEKNGFQQVLFARDFWFVFTMLLWNIDNYEWVEKRRAYFQMYKTQQKFTIKTAYTRPISV